MLAVFVAVSVLMGVVGGPIRALMHQSSGSPAEDDASEQTAATASASVHHLLLAGVLASSAQLTSGAASANAGASLGSGILSNAKTLFEKAALSRVIQSRALLHFSTSYLRGTIWPMGP